MTSSEKTSDATVEATENESGGLPSGFAGPEGGPVAGDPSTEPVATAAQSWVPGRVGPPSIAQDSDAPWHSPGGVEQLKPSTVLPAETVIEGGIVEQAAVDPATLGAGPYGGDTPADETPNAIKATTPGTEPPGADELPVNTPLPGDEKSASTLVPAPAPDGGAEPTTSPEASPSASPSSESAVSSEPAGSDAATSSPEPTTGGTATSSPEPTTGSSESSGSAPSSSTPSTTPETGSTGTGTTGTG